MKTPLLSPVNIAMIKNRIRSKKTPSNAQLKIEIISFKIISIIYSSKLSNLLKVNDKKNIYGSINSNRERNYVF